MNGSGVDIVAFCCGVQMHVTHADRQGTGKIQHQCPSVRYSVCRTVLRRGWSDISLLLNHFETTLR